MGRPIMIILSIVFGMALLSILYVAFSGPIHAMGSTIMAKSGDILKNTRIGGSPSRRNNSNNKIQFTRIIIKYMCNGQEVGDNVESEATGDPLKQFIGQDYYDIPSSEYKLKGDGGYHLIPQNAKVQPGPDGTETVNIQVEPSIGIINIKYFDVNTGQYMNNDTRQRKGTIGSHFDIGLYEQNTPIGYVSAGIKGGFSSVPYQYEENPQTVTIDVQPWS